MNYNDKDQYGIYKTSHLHTNGNQGPGPGLMGAETLLGNDVYNHRDEKVGDIKEIMLDIEKDRLDNAPGFDKDNWPDMADSTWRELIHSYYSNNTL